MKWIKSRKGFLSEAKIRDGILPRQAKEVIAKWGEKYLDMEEVEPTEKIKQGVWKLSNEDKKKALGAFLDTDMYRVYQIFQSMPDRFAEIFKQSIKVDLLPKEKQEKYGSVLSNFDIKDPSLDEIYLLYEPVFRKLAVGETKADEIIQRGEDGRPVMGEDKKPIKIKKEKGAPIFNNNLVNINSFLDDYNNCYPEDKYNVSFASGPVFSIRSTAAEDFSENGYKIDFELFKKDLYLSILHNPKDILNMSISKFYASCQHLYTGCYREMVLGNVFDPNSIPAFLKFDTPIYWGEDKISDQVPLTRMMIRSIEGFSGSKEPKLFFDRCYPDRVKEVMDELVTKYSENIPDPDIRGRETTYLFAPDIDDDSGKIRDPYMDRLNLKKGKYIGKNARSLCIAVGQDWSNILISPKAQIKELTIETTNIPENAMTLPFNLDWVKFKYIYIHDLSEFKFTTKSFGFEKCKFDKTILEQIKSANPEIKDLQLIGCDISDLDFSIFGSLDSLELMYSLEDESLEKCLSGIKINKLIISGDLISNEENKKYINTLRKSGVKVEIKGLVI